MNCRKVRKNLLFFLDGELPSAQAESVRNHLEECDECRREAELLRSTLDLAIGRAGEKSPPPVPENCRSVFWERARAEGGEASLAFPRPRAIRAAKYAAAALAAIVITAAALFLFHRAAEQQSGKASRGLRKEAKQKEVVSPTNGPLAQIERRLEELEAATERLRFLTGSCVGFSADETREIYAAIGLAAANSYRDILKMSDLAAERYSRVASLFPETSAGKEAERILSGLN